MVSASNCMRPLILCEMLMDLCSVGGYWEHLRVNGGAMPIDWSSMRKGLWMQYYLELKGPITDDITLFARQGGGVGYLKVSVPTEYNELMVSEVWRTSRRCVQLRQHTNIAYEPYEYFQGVLVFGTH